MEAIETSHLEIAYPSNAARKQPNKLDITTACGSFHA